jgi:hypothetical protein
MMLWLTALCDRCATLVKIGQHAALYDCDTCKRFACRESFTLLEDGKRVCVTCEAAK